MGLRCRLLIEQQKFREALAVWEGIRLKDKPVYKVMRRDGLAGELRLSVLEDQKRLQYEAELAARGTSPIFT